MPSLPTDKTYRIELFQKWKLCEQKPQNSGPTITTVNKQKKSDSLQNNGHVTIDLDCI